MSDPTLTIVVEGSSDADLVRAILGPELAARVRFFTGRGKMSLPSLGRNILVHEGGPLLVVADADTTNTEQVEEQRGLFRLALKNVAPEGEFDVLLFVPSIEAVLFEAPAALAHVVGRDVPSATLKEGKLLPKPVLATLLGADAPSKSENWGKLKDEDTGKLLAQSSQASALIETVRRLQLQRV